MNKYPAPAPQQYSDYEDDGGPGLGTLGAALAAGALLTPVGRPVRALAKKGLGATDEALGGYGKAGVGKLREAGAAARKAMLGEDDFFRKVGNDYREAEALKLAEAKKLNPNFSAESFSDPAAYMHNLSMTLQGPKSFFGKMFKQDGVGLPLNSDPLKDVAIAAAAQKSATPAVATAAAPVTEELLSPDHAPLIRALARQQKMEVAGAPKANSINMGGAEHRGIASPQMEMDFSGSGFRGPTVADRQQFLKAEAAAELAKLPKFEAIRDMLGTKNLRKINSADANNIIANARKNGLSEAAIEKGVHNFLTGKARGVGLSKAIKMATAK